MIQTKQHVENHGNLGRCTTELWNTFLIWCRRVAEDVDASFRVRLILLTTQTTPMTQPRPFAKWRDGDKIIADRRLPNVARDSEE